MSGRVTLLINSLRGGGAERVCATLANELLAQGFDAEVVVLGLRDAVARESLDPAVPLVDLGTGHVRRSLLAVAKYVRRRRPVCFLVFNHQLAVLLVWLRWLRLGRYRIVARNISTLSRKDALEPSFWHGRVVRALTVAFYRHVDHVVAQSEGMRRDLVAHYGVEPRRISVIHNPLGIRFSLRQAPVPWDARRQEILYVGRLTAIKGLDLLLAACALCMARDPELVLRLVGAGEQKEFLRRQAEAAGIGPRVIFEGFVAETASYYANAKVLALTSQYEGFPNVLIEAHALGTPVVAVDCESGPAEIVLPGRNGYLVGTRDAEALSGALRRALDTRWDLRSIQQSAARYSSRQIAAKYAALLRACPR